MFYGRIDIYWPDGPVESFRLEKPTVAIGRSTGNDIVLDTTAVSRYHTTIALKNQQVTLEDLGSVNGTYVDGVRLKPNAPHTLRGGEEIQVGDVRLIFHPAGEEGAVSSETTQRITLTQPTYRVELEGPDMAVAPGAHAQATVRIENRGDSEDRYFIEIDGLPKGWVRVDQVELEVPPGGQNQAVISFKPLRRSETPPGDYPFTVRVRSRSMPAQTVDAPTMLRVLPYSGFGMALGRGEAANGENFKLYVHNQGNAPLPIVLQAVDPARALRFHLPVAQLTLGPGERRTLSGTVSARRRRLFGQAREHEFAVVARSQDAAGFSASVPGTYVEAGVLPGWVPVFVIPLVTVLALLLVGLALVLFNRDDEPPATPVQPVINRFEVSSPSMTLGAATEVFWDVTQADRLELLIAGAEGERRVPLEGSSPPFALTFDRTGTYALTLQAANGDATATASASVEVRPDVTLGLATEGGLELVRNVEQVVTLSWTVNGARPLDGGLDIRFESSDGGVELPTGAQPASGEQEITVIPPEGAAEWLITLTATGQDGVVASVTQKLPIVYPHCELNVARTLVRRGPGSVYPAVAPTLERPAPPLSPVARDPSGEWLRVTLDVGGEGRDGWVFADDFDCTNFDPERLVVSEDYPPPPAETPSPAPETGVGTRTPQPTATMRPRATGSPTPTSP